MSIGSGFDAASFTAACALGLVDRSRAGVTNVGAAVGGAVAPAANGHRPADSGAVASAGGAVGFTAGGMPAVQSDAPACHVCGS